MSVPGASSPAVSQVFSPRTALLMLLAGIFSFSAYFVLSAYAPDLRSGDDGGAHALSKSAVGYAGLVRLLNAMGAPTAISHAEPKTLRGPMSLLVLTPTPTTDALDLDQAAASAPVALVILPKWQAVPSPTNTGWVQAAGTVEPQLLTPMLAKRFGKVTVSRRADDAPLTVWRAGQTESMQTTGPINQLQTIAGPALTPILIDGQGGVVLARGAGNVFLLSDPDLLDTQGLKSLATARVAVGLISDLRVGQGPVL
ncbi:MAG TPA: hypothetical protein VJP88_11045, partial [Caulobacteraceae bacterium]|nr:hypothetical protein [Caulobacteraceae bacterium]